MGRDSRDNNFNNLLNKMNHNLRIKPRATDWIKGVNSPITTKPINNGDWTAYILFNENQRNPIFDDDGCAVYSANRVLDEWVNYLLPSLPADMVTQLQPYLDTGIDGAQHFHSSPWFTENLTGNGQNGNSEAECYDVIRKYGAIPYTSFNFTSTTTPAEYFVQPSSEQLAQGLKFLTLMGAKNFLQYHWIANDSPKNISHIQQALTESPLNLGINVNDGWNQQYPTDPPNLPPVHAVTAYKVVGDTILVSDNYNPYEKILDGGYPVNYVTQAIVSPIFAPVPPAPTFSPIPAPLPPNPSPVQESNWLTAVSQWIQSVINSLKGRQLTSNQMNSNWKEFLLKTGYAIAGLVISSLIPFLNANPTTLGASTAIIVGVLAVIEQSFFASGGASSTTTG